MNWNPRTVLVVAGLLLPLCASAQDQDDARAARERGATAPFARILAAARQAVSPRAELLDAAMLPDGGRSLVEVFLRERDGRVVSVIVDGQVARVVRVSRGGREAAQSPQTGAAPQSSDRNAQGDRGGDRGRDSGPGRGGDREGRNGGEGGRGSGGNGSEDGRGGGNGGDGGRGGGNGGGGNGGNGGGGQGGGTR